LSTGTDGQQAEDGGERKNEELFVQNYEFMFAIGKMFMC